MHKKSRFTGSWAGLLRSAGAVLVVLGLSGRSAEVQRGWLPTERNTNEHTPRIMDPWVNS